MKAYSLYIHIPFCKQKCPYCDFNSYAGKEALIPAYLDALYKEIKTFGKALTKPRLKTIYLGGGTPTVLKAEELAKLMNDIENNFLVPKDIETTIEANPGTLNIEKLRELKRINFNRISIGTQSFNNTELLLLGRIHREAEIYQSVFHARKAGFANINLDIMFALPMQTVGAFAETLEKALALDPEHISIYNLEIERNTPFYQAHQQHKLSLPSNEVEAEMFELAMERAKETGYEHYEISNFSKTGKRCEHNMTYWQLNDYIGLGAGAHSYVNGWRFANERDIETYIDTQKKRFNFQNTLFQDELTKYANDPKPPHIGEAIFLGLRMLEGINLKKFTERFGIDLNHRYAKEINELVSLGLIECTTYLRLTLKGILLANEVFQRFV